MDANWRPTQGAESTMDTNDWRTQLQPDSRQRIVNKTMETLRRYLPVSGQDGLYELRKIAQRFEEKIYAAATSQSDYLRKISLKMLTMETKTQRTMVNPMHSNAGGPSNKPIDSVNSNVMDANWRPMQGTESTMDTSDWRTQLQLDLQQKLQASSSLLQQQNVLDQQEQLYQSQSTLPDSSSTPLDSTAQTGKSGGDDWQEEVYQKIKSMRESYLPELTEMQQKIEAKLEQHETLPHQPKSDQLEKLKIFKTMLERLIAFLQVSKGNIVPSFKEKMASYEKQIINFINTNRPRKAMLSIQLEQLPQLTQAQTHANQMNSQMQSSNLQSSVATIPQNNIASLQHNSIPFIFGVSATQQNMNNSMQPGANLDSSSVNSLQQVGANTLQQSSVNAPQQINTNHFSSQGGGSVLQQNSQVDQQNLQSANSPFVGPIPLPPLAPSPMPGDSEKPICVVSSVSHAANIGHQPTGFVIVPAQVLAIGTPSPMPGDSEKPLASPLLAEFRVPNGAHGNNALAASSVKLTIVLLFSLILWLVFVR